MTYLNNSLAVARSLAFAAGLTSLGGCATTGLTAPTDQPGLTVVPPGPDLSATLESAIARDYHVSDIHVDVSDSFRTDIDGDGVRSDTAGTALLRNGRRFKSFVFLMTESSSARFLEANGGRFDPSVGGSILSCDSKPIACPDTFERARRQIHPARFRLADFDPAQTGLELSFAYDDGSHGILNALRLFSSE
ncbi:MAG TPA: hypothetical protein VFX30_08120 [bacterium]|nr:hypothetical protein [bacterium]